MGAVKRARKALRKAEKRGAPHTELSALERELVEAKLARPGRRKAALRAFLGVLDDIGDIAGPVARDVVVNAIVKHPAIRGAADTEEGRALVGRVVDGVAAVIDDDHGDEDDDG